MIAGMNLQDLIGTLLGFVLTLIIFSYVLGDNFLFRLAIHVFIGVAAGFAAVIAWYNVIWSQLIVPLLTGSQEERVLLLFPFVLCLLLLTKAIPKISSVGTPVMAFLVGVGAAAAIGGALVGTLFPQIIASISAFDIQTIRQSGKNIWVELFNGAILLVGTVSTFIYFQFGARFKQGGVKRATWIEYISKVGQVFIAITLGAIFSGVFIATLSAMVERWMFILEFIKSFITLL